MSVLKVKDSLGRKKEIRSIRERIGRDLNDAVLAPKAMTSEEQEKLAKMAEYADFRRAENERQLELIKSHLFEYMFNPQVTIRGVEFDSQGRNRIVELSQFDAMMKATTMFLAAMNIQNKLWGLYSVPSESKNGERPTNIKNLTIMMVQELQQMAKKPALPTTARVVENGR